jgi:hypothetical protein
MKEKAIQLYIKDHPEKEMSHHSKSFAKPVIFKPLRSSY